jgi:hypothetical protein
MLIRITRDCQVNDQFYTSWMEVDIDPISFHADCMEEVEQVDASYLTDSQPSDDEDDEEDKPQAVHKKQRK